MKRVFMMTSSIWVLVKKEPDIYMLEIFFGRLKINKNGLFSGPLRKESIRSFDKDVSIQFLIKLTGAIQTDKNVFIFSISAIKKLLRYMMENKMFNAFCRLKDNKLHHINEYCVNEQLLDIYDYDDKSQILTFNPVITENLNCNSCNSNDTENPDVEIYLSNDNKKIIGIIVFRYASGSVRNYGYEQDTKFEIMNIGGVVSKNQVTFSKRNFFNRTLRYLQELGFHLFWGKDNKKISDYSVSSSISYGMDWFNLNGTLKSQYGEYKLSDVLRVSQGKSYVEIDNTVYFLPDPLKNLSTHSLIEDDSIKLPKSSLKQVNDFALSYEISPESYLKNFLKFQYCELAVRDIFCGKLKDYQNFGATWISNLYHNGFGAYLADDMGLGKTIQSISFICSCGRNFNKPVLIISPKTVIYNWQNEFRKFAPTQSVSIVYGNKVPSRLNDGDIVYLTTYETVVSHQDIFFDMEFDSIIIDEAQYVKNFRTQRYKILKRLNAYFRLALSGTPIENNLEELWTIFDLLNPGLLGSYSSFMAKYQRLYDDDLALNRLKEIIKPFILRREKDSNLLSLPVRQDEYIYCNMGESQKSLYDNILMMARKNIVSLPSRYEIKDNSIVLQALLYLREVCSEPRLLPPELQIPCESCKFEIFKEYSRRIMQNVNGKLIVYSLFPRVLQILQNWSNSKGWKTFYIDGSTNNRQGIINEFESSESGVFFISLKAGGVGINLVSCQYVIIYEPWWNLAVEEQAAARVYRVGQKKPVFIYHFLVQDSIEEKIHKLQELKNKLSNDITNDMENPSKVSIEDIVRLLSD